MAKFITIILFLFGLSTHSQNLIKIANESELVFLATVDSIVPIKDGNLGYLKIFDNEERRLFKFKIQRDSFGHLSPEYVINANDTIVILAQTKNDTIVNRLTVSKNAMAVYKAITQLNKVKRQNNYNRRVNLFEKWFVDVGVNKGFKPFLTKIIRSDNDRKYFFDYVGVQESEVKFSAKQKKRLEQEFSSEKCLSHGNFYIVYMLRYSYDVNFQAILKRILSNYCFPFGDGHKHMIDTILYNNKSPELTEIYSRYKKIYYGDMTEAKKVYDEFLSKL